MRTNTTCRCGNTIHNVADHLQGWAKWICRECAFGEPATKTIIPEDMQVKICPECGEAKRANQFHRNSDLRRQRVCADCRRSGEGE